MACASRLSADNALRDCAQCTDSTFPTSIHLLTAVPLSPSHDPSILHRQASTSNNNSIDNSIDILLRCHRFCCSPQHLLSSHRKRDIKYIRPPLSGQHGRRMSFDGFCGSSAGKPAVPGVLSPLIIVITTIPSASWKLTVIVLVDENTAKPTWASPTTSR
jgi:hypothetical protein